MAFRDAEELYFDRMHELAFNDDDDCELSAAEMQEEKEQADYDNWADQKEAEMVEAWQ